MLFFLRRYQESSFSPDLLDRLFNGNQVQYDQVEEAQIVFFDKRTEEHQSSDLNQGLNHG